MDGDIWGGVCDMKIAVLSLGGSVISRDKPNYSLLKKFRSVFRSNYGKYKFVVVCGGGSIARSYISSLRKDGRSIKEQSLAGIMATRMNARFMMQFFGKEANDYLPLDMNSVGECLEKNKVVFCGALRYASKSTSDYTSARLAKHFSTFLINVTNVDGLYDSDPRKNKNAKLIKNIDADDFKEMALKIKYRAGQHFVLDQRAYVLIAKYKIKTYIIGTKIINLDKIFKNKRFLGSSIE